MIRHVCMFTLKEENKESSITEFIRRAQKLKDLETIRQFNVVRNAKDTPDSNYDVALVFDFETAKDLDTYQKCPQHLEFGDFVASVKKERACIDYEL